MKALAIFLIAACVFSVSAEIHSVIVAGSNTYSNYRHQSDACHAYQILVKRGVKAENIILMAYDDIANNSENPNKGKMFNKPTEKGTEGVDVYDGCMIDYKGKDVTPENYLAIIQGKKDEVTGGNGKVLMSGADDTVFLNFADHGATGLIAFPSKYLYSDKLLAAFDYMTQQTMFKEMVYYLESCESGSMFTKLATDTKIYGLAAANAQESSWGTYCPPDDKVDGVSMNSCLGDLFSVSWMEDTDMASTETLLEQFTKVKGLTDKSHVTQYGDLSYLAEDIGDFLGSSMSIKQRFLSKIFDNDIKSEDGKWDSRDNNLLFSLNNYKVQPTMDNLLALQKEITSMTYFHQKFQQIESYYGLTGEFNGETTDFDCMRTMMDSFESNCTTFTDYGLKYVKYFYEVCQQNNNVASMVGMIEEVCQ